MVPTDISTEPAPELESEVISEPEPVPMPSGEQLTADDDAEKKEIIRIIVNGFTCD